MQLVMLTTTRKPKKRTGMKLENASTEKPSTTERALKTKPRPTVDVHAAADGGQRAVRGRVRSQSGAPFVAVAPQEVDGVVDADADHDRREHGGDHVELDAEAAHQPEQRGHGDGHRDHRPRAGL